MNRKSNIKNIYYNFYVESKDEIFKIDMLMVLHGKKTVIALRWYGAKQEKKIHLIYIKFSTFSLIYVGLPVILNTIYLI